MRRPLTCTRRENGYARSGRIIYHLSRGSSPTGGIKVLLDHVEELRAAGFDAFAYVENQAQHPTALDITVPVLTDGLDIRPDDIVIRPEIILARHLEAAAKDGLRQAVFVQNHYYCRHSLGTARCYDDLGAIDVFCASQRVKRFLKENEIAQDATVVLCIIETVPLTAAGKLGKIAAMPRKRASEHDIIKNFLRYVIQNSPIFPGSRSWMFRTARRSTSWKN